MGLKLSHREFITEIQGILKNNLSIEKYLIKCYLDLHNFSVAKSSFLSDYFKDFGGILCEQIKSIVQKHGIKLSLDSISTLLEYTTSPDAKRGEGVVYTPQKIREFIVTSLIDAYKVDELENLKIIDPSCGVGSFLITALKILYKSLRKPFREIVENQVYGIDISSERVRQSILLITLLSLELEGKEEIRKFNIITGNSLSVNFGSAFGGNSSEFLFDLVIGNPPYIRTKNLPIAVKESMRNWGSSKSGLPDIYITFFELGMKILSSNGKLGYISPNTYLRGLNGRNIRGIISSSGQDVKIIDFADYQVFEGISSYTCITFIERSTSDGKIAYSRCDDPSKLDRLNFSYIDYSTLDDFKGWVLGEAEDIKKLRLIENMGHKLGETYVIRNGLATLANDLFIFAPVREDERFYYRTYGKKEFAIEKKVCIDIVKPNVIVDEEDMKDKIEKLLFPYEFHKGKPVIIEEAQFESSFPEAYKFLSEHRDRLSRRDKGKGSYPAWYAFGRTQGLTNFGPKILFPYMGKEPRFFISKDENTLFYCGYAIFFEDERMANVLKKILMSDIFWFYIKHKSKPYSGGYMSLAKNYVVDFGIPDFSLSEIEKIESMTDIVELNKFLERIYFIENESA